TVVVRRKASIAPIRPKRPPVSRMNARWIRQKTRRGVPMRAAGTFLVRGGEHFEAADLAEPELRADGRRRLAIALDHRSCPPVDPRVGEASRDEGRVDAMATVLLECCGAAEQDGRRIRQVHEVTPRDRA